MAGKWTRAAKRGTVFSNETWEVDRRRTSIVIAEPGRKPSPAELILWADANHGVLMAHDLLDPGAPPQAITDSLRRAIASPLPGSGPPRQPRTIRVSRREIAEVLRPVAESLGIQVEMTEDLPLIDEVFREFETQFGSPTNLGYLEAADIPEPLLADLFAAAVTFYREKPWKSLENIEPLLIECTEWSHPYRYGIIMGGGAGMKGLALYDSWRDLFRMFQLAADDPESGTVAERTPTIALIFTPLRDLGPRRQEEATTRGWPLASRNAYPVVVCTGRGRESYWPTAGEVRVLIGAMRAILGFAKTLKRMAGVDRPGPFISEILDVPVAGEDVPMQITFPAPARPER